MIQIEDNKILYEEKGQEVSYLEFIFVNEKQVNIVHTYVSPDYRGKGIAHKLMEYAVNYFEENNIIITASCSYANKWIKKNRYL